MNSQPFQNDKPLVENSSTFNVQHCEPLDSWDNLIFNHPLFKHEEDSLLNIITSTTKTLFKEPSNTVLCKSGGNKWMSQLIKTVFANKKLPLVKDEFHKLGLSFGILCGKLIDKEEIFFRCLDCDKLKDLNSSLYALLCAQCFENSNHDNHRVLMVKKSSTSSATCDCGDPNSFDSTGFCKDHLSREFSVSETINKFPSDFLEKFCPIFKKSFYGVISLFEIANASQQDRIKTTLNIFAQLILESTLIFCSICYNEINEAFLLLFGQLLKSNFSPDANELWHFCADITADKGVRAVDTSFPHCCSCTIAGNLLRVGNLPHKEIQTKLQKLLVECAKEESFKNFLTQEFTKYINFLYNETYSSEEQLDDEANSSLLNMKIQLYATEELCLVALNSGHFQNFVNAMKKVIHNAYQANNQVYEVISNIRSCLVYFLNNKSRASDLITTKTNFISDMLEILTNFQIKFFYEGNFYLGLFGHQVEYRCINRGLMIEKVICNVLEQGFSSISGYSNQEKLSIYRNFIKNWQLYFKTAKSIQDKELEKRIVSFHFGLERILGSIIREFNKEFTEKNIIALFNDLFASLEGENMAEKILEGPLRSLGMVRYLHLVHNLKSGPIWAVYYYFGNLFFETDILTIQSMTIMLEPEILFETLVNNFFSYSKELQQVIQKPESLTNTDELFKQKILLLEDFLHFLIFLMNDELCYLNLKMSKDSHLSSEEVKLSNSFSQVIEKTVVNILLGDFWIDVPHFKEKMNSVLVHHSSVDQILHKVSIIDEKSKKIRIKEEYQIEFDPYIFYRTPAMQRDIINNVGTKIKKDKEIDLISGRFYKNAPCYLKAVQKKIFQSSLTSFLTNFLYKSLCETATIIRPILKLILLNLQVAEEVLGKEYENQLLFMNLQENYFNLNFTNKLTELKNSVEFQDCHPCIEKVKKLLEYLMNKLQKDEGLMNKVEEKIEKEDEASLKKIMAQKRIQQLKEDFKKKQQLFKEKNLCDNEKLIEEKDVNDQYVPLEVENQQLTCQFCLDVINSQNDTYGIPIYVGWTNNLYDVNKTSPIFTKDDNPENLNGDWWPVVSSCMHHYHEKCYASHFKSSRKASDPTEKLFSNNFETHCSLCHTLCNAFLVQNKQEKPQIPDQEDNKQIEYKLYPPLTKHIQMILNNFRRNLKLQNDIEEIQEVMEIKAQEIFKRGYFYYLETYHLFTSVNNIKQKFIISKSFLKEYLKSSKDKKNGTFKSFSDDLTNYLLLHSEESIENKILWTYNLQLDSMLNDLLFDCLLELASNPIGIQKSFIIQQHQNIIKEYIKFRIVQVILCKKIKDLEVGSIYSFFKENETFRNNVLDIIQYPLVKFILATYLNICLLIPDENIHSRFFEALLESNSNSNLTKLMQFVEISESIESLIKESLEETIQSDQILIKHLSEILSYDQSNISLEEIQIRKLAPRMIHMPKTYMDFIGIYLKKKCSQCKEYSQHMATYICLICGEVICLAYCASLQTEGGNLNIHAKKYHLGSSLYLEIQRLSKAMVACSKNLLFEGKDIYIDNLGQPIQNLMDETKYLLYSLDFNKFQLNEEFIQEIKQIIDHSKMAKEIYKVTKDSGEYYIEASL